MRLLRLFHHFGTAEWKVCNHFLCDVGTSREGVKPFWITTQNNSNTQTQYMFMSFKVLNEFQVVWLQRVWILISVFYCIFIIITIVNTQQGMLNCFSRLAFSGTHGEKCLTYWYCVSTNCSVPFISELNYQTCKLNIKSGLWLNNCQCRVPGRPS